ncbi:LysM peptidoglycan-binding domain-containing protein [Endozoicomonas atrinae]|uniref:LysM peptidoglycan-binding domain-containing protein n=1 Tax=Endozoicomonas atrinae TaxID=1333660 RepID=UPI00082431F9|nr:LysM peptidoglycan-binding domain-containing protein [Endozoicomonas atrinae]
MKSLLIIGLAFGLAACSDSHEKEKAIDSDKDVLPSFENSRKKTDSNKNNSLSITNKEREGSVSAKSLKVQNAQQMPASDSSRAEVVSQKPTKIEPSTISGNRGVAESSKHSNKSTSYKLSSFVTSGSEINNLSYSQGSYTVNQNDTLMKIAFEIYGDYEQWRTIKDSNSDKIGSENIIKEGMILTFPEPAEKFIQNKNGDPYLIKRGDTLTSISKNAYGTSRHWKDIWKNNRPLIKDPNLIFAGFTIYIPAITD